ncbi:VOC family protein [Actinokineospora auranticolor]|uniref:Putative enzyme related to lactoylglutathione lyase n=1 Tax=Actinokineospora auranticolor TaxID=155976 RepID=A0A2S6GUH8_9PSEU|nr:VOC family protein [Actinokineospora auranticolor]PPK68847.1 putative enzyme related to lactoylglutathione lyase [Actinokineospora auranticolor]
MTLTLSHTFIAVDDHEAALKFYRDALGLKVTKDIAYEGMRWVSLSSDDQPGVEIVLEPPAADPNTSPADRKVLAELMAKGLLRGVAFATDDVDGTFERVAASGAEVVQEPMDQHYGTRDCAFRDPSGNFIRINQAHS